MTTTKKVEPGPDPALEAALVGEALDAWLEILTINRFARENGGKAHRRLWTALDNMMQNRALQERATS